MKTWLILAALPLLTACGVQAGSSGRNANVVTVPSSGSGTNPQYAASCQAKGGMVSKDGSTCLTTVSVTVGQSNGTSGTTGASTITIAPSFTPQNYLVSSGPSGSAEIMLNGKYVASVNSRLQLSQSGTLSFYVLDATADNAATAIVYTCYDQGLNQKTCTAGVIPN